MNKNLIGNLAIFAGTILFMAGLAHNGLGFPALTEAISQKLIALPSINQIGSGALSQEEIKFNWLYLGLNLNILGLVIIFLSSELKKGTKTAWIINITLGMFFLVIGLIIAGYVREVHPIVVSSIIVGLLLFFPLLIYRNKFLRN